MNNQPILVTGASGKTGSRIAHQLTIHGYDVRRASRRSSTPFDWCYPSTWAAALHQVQAVYICYYPDFAFPGALDILAEFTEAACQAGVTRFVMITGRGETHARKAEQQLLNSVPAATILRSAWFAQNFSEGSLYPSVMEGVIPMPGGDLGSPSSI